MKLNKPDGLRSIENEPREFKVATLFGYQVILAERDAYEIATFVRYTIRNRNNLTPEHFLLQTAKVLESGLKYTYTSDENTRGIEQFQRNLSFWDKRKLKKKLKYIYLLKHLSQAQINSLAEQIYELEGVKADKKKTVTKRKTIHQSSVNK